MIVWIVWNEQRIFSSLKRFKQIKDLGTLTRILRMGWRRSGGR